MPSEQKVYNIGDCYTAQCPVCDEQFGKATEMPKRFDCCNCGTKIKNPRGE